MPDLTFSLKSTLISTFSAFFFFAFFPEMHTLKHCTEESKTATENPDKYAGLRFVIM